MVALKSLRLSREEIRSPWLWTPVVVAIILAVVLILSAGAITGGGHGRYLFVVVAFPYVFVLGSILRQSDVLTTLFFWAPAFALFAELPLYGVLVGLVLMGRIAVRWIAVVALAHVVAIVLLLTMIDHGLRLF